MGQPRTYHSHRPPTGRRLRWTWMALVVALVAASCSDPGPEVGEDSIVGPSEGAAPKPPLVLVVNDWTASALNVTIAELLIERYLGYPVLPTRMDDTNQIFESLAEGSADAVLEVWPSTLSDRQRRLIDRGDVANIGPLGAVGKVGWFVPGYVVAQNPRLATWEGYASSEVASQFATADTHPTGRFLGTNPTYQQYDEQIIANLGLPFVVEFSGSEEATMDELEARYSAGDSILLYWWTPTAAVATYDLVNVVLPASNEACQAAAAADDGTVACDYPEDVLFKVASPELVAKAPDAARFLAQFTLTTEDQIQLLAAVEHEDASFDAAAQAWIDANQPIWQAWLDEAQGEVDPGQEDGG